MLSRRCDGSKENQKAVNISVPPYLDRSSSPLRALFLLGEGAGDVSHLCWAASALDNRSSGLTTMRLEMRSLAVAQSITHTNTHAEQRGRTLVGNRAPDLAAEAEGAGSNLLKNSAITVGVESVLARKHNEQYDTQRPHLTPTLSPSIAHTEADRPTSTFSS